MVNRVFTDNRPELVALCRRFVCLKFCERDDKESYYRAAGYFLPQWYWQPIMAITYPDGREIDIHWRRTHEAPPVAEVMKILSDALKAAGDGIDPEAAAKGRDLCNRADAALEVQDFDGAERLAGEASALAPRGWVRTDAEKLARKAKFLRETRSRLERLQAGGDESSAAGDLAAAMSLCLAGAHGGALDVLAGLPDTAGETAETARWFRESYGSILRDSLELLRVSHERFRYGPDPYLEIRAEFRNRLGPVEGLAVQYSVLLDDGRAYAAWEGYGKTPAGDHLRGAVLLPGTEAAAPERIADVRAELLFRGESLGSRRLADGEPANPWWNREEVRPLRFHGDGGSFWLSPGLRRSGENGVRLGAAPKVLDLAPPSPAREELVPVFEQLDGGRFSIGGMAAQYRLAALGRRALPAWLPLAHRYGGYVTLYLLSPLARINDPKAAAALLHVVGADDVTLKYPAFQQVRWLEGREDVPVEELAGNLETGTGDAKDLAARSLGMIGRKEGFLPLLGHLRSLAAGSARAESAVAAIADLTGRDFGLDPSKPLAEQGEAVKRIAEWWKAGASKEPRAVWMAQALEEAGIASSGALAKACRDGDGDAASGAVSKALESGKPRAVRCALAIAKDLKLRALTPAVLDLFLRMEANDPNLGLARNVLRDGMDAKLLESLIAALKNPGKTEVILDFLLVLTAKLELYPMDTGPRMGKKEREALQAKWAAWFEAEKAKLRWDAEEGRFTAGA